MACTHVSVDAPELTDDSRFNFCRWNFSNNSPPPAALETIGTVALKIKSKDVLDTIFNHSVWRNFRYLMFRLTFVALLLGISGATGRFTADVCCCICPATWCCSWFCVGMTILSVSESLRELFAVDVAVLGLSRSPVLGSLVVCDDDLSDWIAAGSGDFDWTDVTSWIDGRAFIDWIEIWLKVSRLTKCIQRHGLLYSLDWNHYNCYWWKRHHRSRTIDPHSTSLISPNWVWCRSNGNWRNLSVTLAPLRSH